MKRITSAKAKRIWMIALCVLAVFCVFAAIMGFLFLRTLLAEENEAETWVPFVVAEEETTADAEAQRLNALLQESAPEKVLSPETQTHRENELVFSVSMADFIESFNGYYWADHAVRLLPPQENWSSVLNHTSIHCDWDTMYYVYSRDERIHSLPTLSVYVPSDADLIQEITVDFDYKGYDRDWYEEYEAMGFYALRVFFPDLPEQTLKTLVRTLSDYAFDHMLPNEKGYYHGAVPELMYHRNGVGVYPYFAVGEFVHLCIIPVTEASLSAFRAQGTRVEALTETGF